MSHDKRANTTMNMAYALVKLVLFKTVSETYFGLDVF